MKTQKEIIEGSRLSPQQERLFLLQRDERETPYRTQGALLLEGALDTGALRSALRALVGRHEILRTVFRTLPGMTLPVQLVNGTGEVVLREYDLAGLAAPEQDARLDTILGEMNRRPVDFARGPLFEPALIRLALDRHVLAFSLPAVCSDADAPRVIARDLACAYAARGGETAADEGPLQYADYAEWQHELLTSEETRAGREFWAGKAFPALDALRLPFEGLTPAPPREFDCRSLPLSLAPGLAERIDERAREQGSTPANILLACWQALLYRLTGQPRVVVGVAFDGRKYDELRDALGLFACHLPVAPHLDGATVFGDALAKAGEEVADALEGQEYFGWEHLAGADGGRAFFPFAFEYAEEEDGGRHRAGDLFFSVLRARSVFDRSKLKLRCGRTGDRVSAEFQYDAALLSAESVGRLGRHFETLLASALADPRAELGRLEILPEDMRRQLLYEFNDTRAGELTRRCLHELVEAQARVTPDAPAVHAGGEWLSYGELNARANQLAHHLRASGVGPDELVGVCLERSAWMVVALLGILKAGGAYVPLDPDYPAERLAFMLEDTGAAFILTEGRLRERLPATRALTVCLDAEWEMIAGESRENLRGVAAPDGLAYVIYTSGSTGRPKGVMISHRSIGNRLLWMQKTFPLGPGDRVLQKTVLSFDASVWELFVPLIAGAQLVMALPGGHQDSAYLVGAVAEEEVTVLQLVPSMLRAVLDEPHVERCRSLRRMFCGGELLPLELKQKFFRRLDAELVNLYGPTETSIDASYWVCERDDERPHVPIGRPLANVRIYILDAHLRPAPVGVPGELYVGGAGLARGYWRRPELTADRFIPHPFSEEPGARLYRTGDLARYHPDGSIEYFGRTDRQVKLRGFRIELGEIESALSRHPSVREAAVVMLGDEHEQQRLVAYVVAGREGGAGLDDAGALHRLPNGLEVAHLNRNETETIYREIFEEQTYLKHGVALDDGACVFDVGANIGLFTLFVHERCRGARVFAFEPSPDTFDKLEANAALYGLDVKLFDCGLSNEAKELPFTFYPRMSSMSGVYARADADEQLARAAIAAQGGALSGYSDELLAGRFAAETFNCRFRTVSDVMREHGVERIDLLKIDVERSELDVLEGVADEDWPKIEQIVLEVHDDDGRLARVKTLLEGHGFGLAVEQDEWLRDTGLYNVYARRPTAGARAAAAGAVPRAATPLARLDLSADSLRRYLAGRVPGYMLPAAFVVLSRMPLLPNGKVDRKALHAPEQFGAAPPMAYAAPRTPVEEVIAGVWAEVLGLERVGVNDNFFDLGGHSLLATQVVSRVRALLRADVSLRGLFEAPTVEELARGVEQSRAGGPRTAAPPLAPVSRDGALPLSFAQERLWFMQQLEPGSAAYHLFTGLRLHGRLDAGALERTINEVVRRHESLRTTFKAAGGRPAQVVAPRLSIPLPVINLAPLVETEREAEVVRLAGEEARRPFDLEAGPLLRTQLLRLAEEKHVLFLTLHHIIGDGWSNTVMLREVVTLYEAFTRGLPSPLPEPSLQYADYAVWQREWLRGEALEEHLSYWRDQLRDLPTLELPTDRPRPPVQSYNGAAEALVLSKELTGALRALSRREGVTLHMTLLAAFKALLSRYSGQTDLVVGGDIANRTRVETEGLIGFFVNMLVLRTDLSGDPTFTELLGRVRETTLGAYAHQEVPFEKIVEELQPRRDANRNPFFQVMFTMQNLTKEQPELHGLRAETVSAQGRPAKFDLTLAAREGEDALACGFEYSPDLFDRATIERMLGHLTTLLEGIAADPSRRLSELPLMTAEERRHIAEWGAAGEAALPAERAHELFEAQAARSREAVAVTAGGSELTYEQLNLRANQLARYLKSLGVGPDVLVGLCLSRTPSLLVAVLGVLKAGAAYVPLEPEHPLERLAFILEETKAPVLLTEERLLEKLPAHFGHVLCLDTDWDAVAAESGENLSAEATRDNLTYVIYTSGSSGRPKGVMVSHGGLVNYLSWATGAYRAAEGTGSPVHSPLGFDLTVTSLFTPLLAGRGVVLLPEELAGEGLRRALRHGRDFSLVKLTPAHLALLARTLRADEAAGATRALVVGGEALTAEHLAFWREHSPETRIVNEYGPTETVVGCCVYEVPPDASPGGNIPIGRPIVNTRLHVLDGGLRAVPVGVPGELCVGGAGLARGYLYRPDLTAESFIPDPFSSEPGARLYRTGDLVRYLPDGNLEFIGRRDQQVKVRGYRVEPGEIEGVLARHHSVSEAVVAAREDGPGGKRLVAYLTAREGQTCHAARLRDYLGERLPDYMVPASFVVLEELPLTANGKVDRARLPAPDGARPDGDYVAPRGPVEEVLAGMWAELLSVERVGAHDDFFALGGHSLLVTQLLARLLAVFRIEMPLLSVFQSPTLAGFAEAAAAHEPRPGQAESVARALQKIGRLPDVEKEALLSGEGRALAGEDTGERRGGTGTAGLSGEDLELLARVLAEEGFEFGEAARIPARPPLDELPLSFAQRRLWFLDQLQPGSPVYNIPAAARLKGRLDVSALERVLTHIERRHEVLRTTFAVVGGRPVQVVGRPREIVIPVVNLEHLPAGEREAEASRLCRGEALRPFDLSAGPLWRALLVRLTDAEHIAVLTMHHIVSDGWSREVLVRELATLYEAFTQGRPSPLPELPVQYADYAVWQREWLRGEALEGHLSYWRDQLRDLPALELPTDRPRPATRSFRGARQVTALTKETTDALAELGRQEGATLFMVLLSALSALLSRYCGQKEVVVGTPVGNRGRAELEGLIGFFVNALVLRVDVGGCGSFRELTRRAREVCLGAYAHEEVPFERLVEELAPERSLSQTPLFQVALVLQNVPRGELRLPGLSLEMVGVETGTAKFDLTFVADETEHGLWLTLEYNTDLFEHTTVARLLNHFRTLAEEAAARPDRAVDSLPLMTEPEREALLGECGGGDDVYRRPESLPRLFEEQVERTPDAFAVSCGDERLTYGELNRRANRVAHHLRERGVGAESVVGICVERSAELVVGLLGIVKAGGAYLPLDPTYPEERLSFLLDDARVEVVVTQRHLPRTWPEGAVEVVYLDEAREEIGPESEQNISGVCGPENLAYVIYTSGSTGSPKGVAVTHSNVTRLFAATQRWYGFSGRDVWTLFHSYAFDFSVWELWGALLYGGRLVVVPSSVSRTPEAFYELLLGEGVTVLNQTPSAFRQLMLADEAAGGAGEGLALRLVIFGGEALEPRLLQKWYARHGEQRPLLVNMYGITETTVHVTYRPLRAADARDGAGSVIGVRIPDLQVYILDEHMQPVPVGVPGELYVGGAGLARGYLRRAALTAERFVPHPFGGRPGARLYRSGDLARHLPGGDIEYLGRADEQVKIRGFRIEPGEVEAALCAHEAVEQAAVVAREDVPGERRLVAYVVASRADGLTTVLRDYLKGRLPEHMIPSAFIPLERLPLTAHGKLDRRALPAPGDARPELSRGYAAPRDIVEETLATIWEHVIRVERVGIDDNFFELGGDSILSVRVLAMAKEKGINFSLQQLFQHQTIRVLAGHLKAGDDEAATAGGGPFSLVADGDRAKLPPDVEDAYPLAMLQAGMLYHMAYAPGEMVYHNVYSYTLRARLDAEAIREAVWKAAARHAILRTSFDLNTYSEPLQLVHRVADFPVPIDDLRQSAPEEQERLLDEFVESEKQRRFDYSRPPLLRFHVHLRTQDTFNFTLTECHPILDGWSLHSLLAEVFTSYFAALAGRPVEDPPPLASSYREFIRRERLALASEECRAYWQGKLRDLTPMELPRSHGVSRPAGGPRIARFNHPLSADTSKGLKKLARSLGVPLKSVLLAAHLKVLSVICGRTDVVTGLLSTGRPEETDAEKVLGLFFNTLPFHAEVAGGTWRELIKSTFEAELELLPYRRYPVAALQRQWGRKPLFESVFNYLHFHVLDDLAKSGDLELVGATRFWEETNLTLSTAFVVPPLSEQVVLTLRFDTTQFGEAQIESVGGHYGRVLDAMVKAPDARHDALNFLAPDEMRKLLTEWGVAPRAVAEEGCVHRLFEERAAETPDAVGVVCEGVSLTYGQLNGKANRLAHYLRRRGVGPETPVAICLGRSAEAVICLLGVLKAGGAYLPIEPGHPPQRIAAMLAQVGAPLLLTRRGLAEGLALEEAAVVYVDAVLGDGARASEHNPESGVSPGNLAYLILTSGSTGEPKAVAVEHRQLHNYASGILKRLELPGPASYALASTFATDLGHTAIFPPLVSGGTLHVLSPEAVTDPEALAEYFDLHHVDCLKIVPTHLAALLKTLPTRRIIPRRRLVLGGDICGRELVEQVRELAPDCVILNHYGPTETTVGVLSHRLEPVREGGRAAPVPLGRPLPGSEVYILGPDLHPVPAMTPGEIYIGGAGVARGYFNQPSLTAERFIPNPFSERPGARLYKTGDGGRYLPDGKVEFLGRGDQQVKIRGYRVELGEVEAVLRQHPEVGRAVATVDGDEPHDRRIVAYVTAGGGPPPTREELRRHLRERLPEYAVPAALVLLDEMPLSPGGKIDRRALPRPSDATWEADIVYAAPSDEMERTIAAVWGDLLQVERMGVNDNFFDLGGHSLVLLQVQSRLREVLGRDISIVEMFEHPTIRSLARHFNPQPPEAQTFRKAHEEAAARRATLGRRSRRGKRAPD